MAMHSSRDRNSCALLWKNSRGSPLNKLVKWSRHIFQEMLLCAGQWWIGGFLCAPFCINIYHLCSLQRIGFIYPGGQQLLEILGIEVHRANATGLPLSWCIDRVYQ
ncbi:uncharacterized protein LOC120349559 [Nilaparvata lugens]|uniref:uncharacterized protein LOC120349559 n=1 Tax=Nilaparvata lugens TaxID=108931 RepID=UPI00193D11F1|nr:uncharacterized protein LOC120349559 [Nilaparvata lugens]